MQHGDQSRVLGKFRQRNLLAHERRTSCRAASASASSTFPVGCAPGSASAAGAAPSSGCTASRITAAAVGDGADAAAAGGGELATGAGEPRRRLAALPCEILAAEGLAATASGALAAAGGLGGLYGALPPSGASLLYFRPLKVVTN